MVVRTAASDVVVTVEKVVAVGGMIEEEEVEEALPMPLEFCVETVVDKDALSPLAALEVVMVEVIVSMVVVDVPLLPIPADAPMMPSLPTTVAPIPTSVVLPAQELVPDIGHLHMALPLW